MSLTDDWGIKPLTHNNVSHSVLDVSYYIIQKNCASTWIEATNKVKFLANMKSNSDIEFDTDIDKIIEYNPNYIFNGMLKYTYILNNIKYSYMTIL